MEVEKHTTRKSGNYKQRHQELYRLPPAKSDD